MIMFGGTSNENIEHFLYGFKIFFDKEASTACDVQVQETNAAKVYLVIHYIKPGSIACKFV